MSTERPLKIELHKNNFTPGSLGFATFPDILEGRRRHQTVFDQPYYQLVKLSVYHGNVLTKLGVETPSDLLNVSMADLRGQTRSTRLIRYRVLNYLGGPLSVGPEGFLLRAVFPRGESIPLPVEFEQERELAVASGLATLQSSRRNVLEKRFGIADGKTRTIEQVHDELSITRERVRNLEQKGLRNLRHPSTSTNLSLYAPLPKDSLAKEFWPFDFSCQINQQIALDLTKTRAEDIYSSEYLRAEFPSTWRVFRNYSLIPLTLVMHFHAYELGVMVAQEFRRVFQSLKK